MPARLAKSFANDPKWIEAAVQIDQGLRKYGYYNYDLLLRPATKAEQIEISKDAGTAAFIHVELDEVACSAEYVLGIDPVTGDTAIADCSPEEFAMINIVDVLDMLLLGSDPLDPDNRAKGRSFRVIKGGKGT